MTVKEAADQCGTGSVHGLSIQIIAVLHQLKPGKLIVVQHPKIKAANPLAVNLLLQPAAASALLAAVNQRNQVLTVNSCYRTVAQQYILRHHADHDLCGINVAALPGRSNHEGGVGIDVAGALGWRPFMAAHQWKRLVGDPPHFDFKGEHDLTIDNAGVQAFQVLWNKHKPNDQLKEDGIYGNETKKRLEKSPAAGF